LWQVLHNIVVTFVWLNVDGVNATVEWQEAQSIVPVGMCEADRYTVLRAGSPLWQSMQFLGVPLKIRLM
jgi:hypothetical protein